ADLRAGDDHRQPRLHPRRARALLLPVARGGAGDVRALRVQGGRIGDAEPPVYRCGVSRAKSADEGLMSAHNSERMNDDALRVLAAEIKACTACPLHRSARQAVPGEGSPASGIFFLGEAPGYNEDVQGRPFVGAAGQLLDELLQGIGLDRSKVFITNVVRHRPPENRDPMPDEVAACDVWLRRHLEILQPRVIVTLGRHAMYK